MGKPHVAPDHKTLLFPYDLIQNDDKFWTKPATVHVARSSDGGATWKDVVAAQQPNGGAEIWNSQLAIAPDGARVGVVFTNRTADNGTRVMMAESRDGGLTFAPPIAVSNATGNGVLPWIAARADGTFAIGYYATRATGDTLTLPDTAAWDAVVAIVDPVKGVVAQGVASDGPVKMGPLCPYGSGCDKGKDRELLDYVSLAIDKAGRAHLAYATSSKKGEALVRVASQKLS
jgi:hypothetical protein